MSDDPYMKKPRHTVGGWTSWGGGGIGMDAFVLQAAVSQLILITKRGVHLQDLRRVPGIIEAADRDVRTKAM